MLRKFKISIDGTQYLVEMEEIGAPAGPAPVVAAPAPEPAPAPAAEPAPAPAAAPSANAPAGAHTQEAPMPGTILDIHVNVGDTVEVNQPVMVLEAMKMESEIVAEQAGTIASINVAKGDMVNPGDLLFSIS
ncbi:MAG: acetyl-CoA carboxylase biotin carboxyl carrier protein subunit [Enorma sp.]|uniref:acetyl-CoA carboxylase biotin carboxyl carrier protein subunit n=1 Tax=Enorma sp. TaxID=1920692 RepID=UPI002590805A|nr:acetyl-CoA carboxylase biotin carboxyl carrier protein subunit [Enorma sp.]MCI7774960.1 acetyl-CoA carboxylase biotin carboxyl carrier protein subunit [Enorma sp.]